MTIAWRGFLSGLGPRAKFEVGPERSGVIVPIATSIHKLFSISMDFWAAEIGETLTTSKPSYMFSLYHNQISLPQKEEIDLRL
jgi:hypothetical protein